jgi:hypothetical protein
VAAAALLLGGACGGGDAGIERPAARTLNQQIDLVEFAASAHEYDAARHGLERLRAAAERFADRGEIDDLRLARILDAVDDLDRSLADA